MLDWNEVKGNAVEIMTGLALLGAGLWKARLRVRADSRMDATGAMNAEVHKHIIEQLKEQMALLGERLKEAEDRATALEHKVRDLTARISDEINRRYIAENTLLRLESEALGLKAINEELRSKLAAGQVGSHST